MREGRKGKGEGGKGGIMDGKTAKKEVVFFLIVLFFSFSKREPPVTNTIGRCPVVSGGGGGWVRRSKKRPRPESSSAQPLYFPSFFISCDRPKTEEEKKEAVPLLFRKVFHFIYFFALERAPRSPLFFSHSHLMEEKMESSGRVFLFASPRLALNSKKIFFLSSPPFMNLSWSRVEFRATADTYDCLWFSLFLFVCFWLTSTKKTINQNGSQKNAVVANFCVCYYYLFLSVYFVESMEAERHG